MKHTLSEQQTVKLNGSQEIAGGALNEGNKN